MSSAVCSNCGVAVVPGYVRCPKCHMALPTRAGRPTEPGGTALPERGGLPIAAVFGGALAAVAVVAVVVMLRGPATPRVPPVTPTAAPTAPVTPGPATTVEVPITTTTAPTSTAPVADPTAAIAALDRALDRQRLWSTTERVGARLDLRGTACAEPAMAAAIAEAAPALKAGGITSVRCLAQAGTVVIDRAL